MSDGLLLVDKPAGPTSHDVVAAARRALGIRRVGHAGTLDPAATGLLVVLVGRATRLARFIAMVPKRYAGTIRFGCETSTDDAAGEPRVRNDAWRGRSRADVEAALAVVAAAPTQVAPAVSARKIDGQRAYAMARRGETVTLAATPVTITALRLARFDAEAGEADVLVTCGAGTYVRAIARDVGRALGSAAHLARLRRIVIGPWFVEEAVTLEVLREGGAADALRPMDEAVAHLPRVDLEADDARRFGFGQKLPVAAGEGFTAVFAAATLVGVGEVRDGVLGPAVGLVP